MIGSINRRLVATFTSRDAKRGPFPPALSASSLQSCMAVDDHKKHDDAPKMRPQGLYPSFKGIRKRRILIAVAAIWLLYLFFNNLPAGLTPAVEREDTRYGRLKPDATSREPPDSDQTDDTVAKDATTYDGPLKFYELGASLKASRHLHDSKDNVLFAFASSASTVVAAACTMAYQNRTKVHIASMGREDIKMANVLKLNSIPESECPVIWHHAQPDFARQSSRKRMEAVVKSAIAHIHHAIPMQAIFYDDRDDDFLPDSVNSAASERWVPTLRVPNKDAWSLSLDAKSLRHWHDVQINILIHAPRESAGGLLRLLRTIRDADYGGLTVPRITIELPASTDPFVLDVLSRFQWPLGSPSSASRLTVRHRVDTKLMTPAVTSLRTIESFYPANPSTSHVLLLSTDVELAPNYYQFLMYTLLENKYSSRMNMISSTVMGVSLEQSQILAETHTDTQTTAEGSTLLWQHVSPHAALYTGDKWQELHELLAHRLAVDPQLSRVMPDASSLSDAQPVWVRLLSELMQAKGYFMLHPLRQDADSSLITLHQELRQDVEEGQGFDAAPETSSSKSTIDLVEEDGVLGIKISDNPDYREEIMLAISSITSLINDESHKKMGQVAGADDVLFYSSDGGRVSWIEAQQKARDYAETFSRSIGGCSSGISDRVGSTIEGLFCVSA